MRNHFLIAVCLLFAISSCKKDKTNPVDQLPPETQTGANTFGCLVNGEVYKPSGFSGTGTPNPKIQFDIGLNGFPYLQMDIRQYEQNSQVGSLVINIDSVIGIGTYKIYQNRKQIGFGSYLVPSCGILPNDNIQFKSGFVQLTKYDLNSGIISGHFSFKIKPNNCDTLFFTDGRFDFKL